MSRKSSATSAGTSWRMSTRPRGLRGGAFGGSTCTGIAKLQSFAPAGGPLGCGIELSRDGWTRTGLALLRYVRSPYDELAGPATYERDVSATRTIRGIARMGHLAKCSRDWC